MKRDSKVVTKEQMLAELERAHRAIHRAADLAVDCDDVSADSKEWKSLRKADHLVFEAWLDLKYGKEGN